MKESGNKNAIRAKETTYSKIVIKDGIAQCSFKNLEILDVRIAAISVQDRIEFFQEKSYPCLFDITAVKHSTKEARDYLANEGNELINASAIVVSSPVIKMMANFYISVNKPKNPTRMFTNKESALEWLSQYKTQE